MDHEGRGVDLVGRVVELAALDVDLHQAGRRDLVEQQPVRVDQELILAARHAQRDVVVDQVVHAEPGDHAVAGRQLDPGIPLRRSMRRGPLRFAFMHCSCTMEDWNDFMLSSSIASSSVRLRRDEFRGGDDPRAGAGAEAVTVCSSFTAPGRAVMTSTRSPRKIASSTSWVMKRMVRRYAARRRAASAASSPASARRARRTARRAASGRARTGRCASARRAGACRPTTDGILVLEAGEAELGQHLAAPWRALGRAACPRPRARGSRCPPHCARETAGRAAA